MPLRVYDTLKREKLEFKPLQPGKVGMYVCGPTVYKPSHIGHMVGPVIFDTVKRYLVYSGYQVTWVVNITDVDDKLIARAPKENMTVKELAEKMTVDYLDCLKKLNVTGIDKMPKATEHIPEMIGMIRKLMEKGFAYPAGGDVYFDVTKDHDYGKLCHRKVEDMEAGEGVEGSERKRNKADFALWKGAKPGEPSWESPWGPGRPGWHIECSAMSMKYLGQTLDIHGGGLDLQFPHHENELAQSESFTDQPFARYWMHNGLLQMGAAKMAGSVGNVVNVASLLAKFDPGAVRFFLLQTHYRSPSDFADWYESMLQTEKALGTFQRFFERYQRITGDNYYQFTAPTQRADFTGSGEFLTEVGKLRQQFLDCMDDDFNTGGAIGVLYQLLTAVNRFADTRQLESGKPDASAVADFRSSVVVFKELAQILGLFWEPPASKGGNDQLVNGLMRAIIELRAEIRKEAKALPDKAQQKKIFDLADLLRARLKDLGVTLEDRAGGTGWRLG